MTIMGFRATYCFILFAVLPNLSSAAYKCQTETGLIYQDKPCAIGKQTDFDVRSDREKNWAAHQAVMERDDKRAHQQYLKRAAEKVASLKACAGGKTVCGLSLLHGAVQYLAPGHIEQALGPSKREQRIHDERLSYWTVRINDLGHPRTVRIQVGWGHCPDEDGYRGEGYVSHACDVNLH